MSATYEPGSVADATVRGVPNVRVFRLNEGTWVSAEPAGSTRVHHDEHVTDVRSLVVLDPAECADPLILATACAAGADALRETNPGRKLIDADALTWLADQIEAQTRQPKPAEPTGLGAVVEDARGGQWVRWCHNAHSLAPWLLLHTDDTYSPWGGIDAVRVLSEGVTQ